MPLTTTFPRRRRFRSLSPHGLPPRRLARSGATRTGRRGDVRARCRAQRARFRRPRRSAVATRTVSSRWTCRAAASGLAGRPARLCVPHVPDHPHRADRGQRRRYRRLGRHLDGRPARASSLAAQPNTPMARLVVNDVGPVIEPAALERIRGYLGDDPAFATLRGHRAYVRTISAPFGRLSDAQWDHLVRTNVRQDAEGRWRIGYDPGIAVPFRAQAAPPTCGRCGTRCAVHARAARRALRPAERTHGGGDGRARPARAGRRDCGRGPRADADGSHQIDPVVAFLRA